MLLRLAFVLSIGLAAATAQTTTQQRINRGVALFKQANYAGATAEFQKAVDQEPGNVDAQVYLATALLSQWIPGASAPENAELARRAEACFQSVLNLDSRNVVALKSLASLAFNQANALPPAMKEAKLDEAARWYQRLVSVDARNTDAWYSLGVIAWSKFYPAMAAARASAGMRPEDPAPLRDTAARVDLRRRYLDTVEDGMKSLAKALEIDPNYSDAMAYMNLLYRERADLANTAGEAQADTRMADEWVMKALDVKRSAAGRVVTGGIVAPAPPPPPPPAAPASIRPVDGSALPAPSRIRVGSNVQSANLVSKVDPVYPPLALQARIQGVVRYNATIGKDGRVQNLQLISGHPLLVPAATEAVQQWLYRPTLLNGEPVEVVTTIEVPFRLNQ